MLIFIVMPREWNLLKRAEEVEGGVETSVVLFGGAFDSAKNHKRQRRKRQSVTAKREKSQTPKFV